MAACSIATEPSGLYWDRKGSRSEVGTRLRHRHPPGHLWALGNPKSTSTPSIDHTLDPFSQGEKPVQLYLAFSYFVPRKGTDEYVFQSRHTIGAILGRLSEADGPESSGCNEIYGANHESSEDAPKAPVEIKMRSASRKPKRLQRISTVPLNIQHARECHNNVEKKYRTRLKIRFEKLLMVLHASKPKNEGKDEDDLVDPDYSYSRGEVLDAARQRILTLEENKRLTSQIKELKKSFMAGRGRQ
ncbi:Alkaline ceramidase YPC1 [Fusarium oxysporum f. sp. albedinis]|nr:Alkaline ceramidase YPC1 [Fusarium oxysporum f. sp. albedinis]